jgi:hypothetical protein
VEVDVVSLSSEFPNDNPALHRGVSWVCLETTGCPVAILEARPPEPEIVVAIVEPEPEPEIVVAIVEPEPEPEIVVAIVEPEPTSVSLAELVAPLALERFEIERFEIEEEEPPVPAARISGIVPVGMDHDLDGEDEDEAAILVEELPPLDEHAIVEGAVVAAEAALAVVAVAPESTALPPAIDDPFTVLLCTLADVAVGAGSPHVASVLPGLLLHGRLDHAMPDDAAQALAEADVAHGTEVTAAFIAQTHAWRAILLGTSDDFGACGNAMLDEWAADLVARLLGAPARAAALRRELRSRGVAAFGLVEAA